MNDFQDRQRPGRRWLVICVPIMSALVALHAGCAGCAHGGPPDEVFGYALYQVVGAAIQMDSSRELGGANVRMLVFGYDANDDVSSAVLAATTDDSGAFVLPVVVLGFGQFPVPAPAYVVLQAEWNGRTACAAITLEEQATQWHVGGPNVVDLGVVVFDFAAGPCNLPAVPASNGE